MAAQTADGRAVERAADLVLVITGVRPDTGLAAAAGASLGVRGRFALRTGRLRLTGRRDGAFTAGMPALLRRCGLHAAISRSCPGDSVTVWLGSPDAGTRVA